MPQTAILTPEQLDAFDRQGVLRLPGFYPEADIRAMAERLWADIERRFGMLRDQPDSWTVSLPAQFHGLVRSGAFDALGSGKMTALADALLGAGKWDPPSHWGAPLVTFPTVSWGLPRPPWHTDTGACRYLNPMPVLRAFTFLAPVGSGGGGTLYVGGSHRLALEMDPAPDGAIPRSAEIRKRLGAEHPWFARLLAAPGRRLSRADGRGRAVRGPHGPARRDDRRPGRPHRHAPGDPARAGAERARPAPNDADDQRLSPRRLPRLKEGCG